MSFVNEQGVSRRRFLQGAGLAAASVAAAGMVAGCASADKPEKELSDTGSSEVKAYEPAETMDVDIVVVGSGSSGVAATVQAAELGAKTLLLEKSSQTGGNGRLTEGMFAINSQMQKEKGVGADVTFTDIIAAEQEFFNYRINNLLWKDMVDASGDNIDWMASHGVQFSGVVDDYHGLGKFDCFHWFDNNGSGSCYIDPMLESAQQLGATVMTETPAVDLIIEDGKVVGLYAEKKDGSILQVNAKAVILTSGGYAQNEEIMGERGWDLTYSHNNGVEGHDGDGLRMAIAAGAHDVSRERCFLREAYSFGIDFFADMSQTIHRGGPELYVNQDGERYTNEGCGSFVPQCVGNAVHTQPQSYMVLSKDIIDTFVERSGYEGLQADMDDAAAQCPGDNIYKADTIEELAKLQGLEPAMLKASVDRYNELCDKGVDEDFNKASEDMVALKTAPFYIFRQDMAFWTSIGGIDTNRKMEVVTPRGEAIPGLYAAGTDGCNLYRETYTMSIPASCNANNCNSGRTAAKSAFETCVKA
ncbi:FAD-dependent oxidoreductase [Adlercreutzia equolifaciens]|uniref:FAD-dependent oxidoreductase n=1 Tax=Adlercreutzia equolifaciens TaxID=446660 RepID=UPI0023AF603B|nr:FAD-binding protein [Adlercreutzia equolifaciens]MDE8702168.1 FAD-dependent oxidoreductase [Adlercreutzia equolifaciens]